MGLLSKLLKKTGEAVVDPKPVEKPFQQKKITNPLVRKKVPNLQTSDYQKQIDDSISKGTISTPTATPNVIGQLYSPVRSTVEQIQYGKKGVKGENLAKRVKEFAPNVSGSEKNFANIKLDPKKRYTQTELLDLLEGKADNYEVRVRKSEVAKNRYKDPKKRKSNALYEGMQRQRIEDKELDYFELTVHTPRINPEVEKITEQHFEGGVTAHARVSLREDSQGKRYILLEESQSDAARMADTKVDREVFDETFDMDQFDRQEELNRRLDDIPQIARALDESTFSLDDGSIYKNRFSDFTYIRRIIEEDPILSNAIKKDGGKTFTSSELRLALEEIENGYKGQNNNIAKDVSKYFKDLDELIDKDLAARKAGEKPIDSSKLHSKGFMDKYGNSLDYFKQNLKDSDQDFDVYGGLYDFDESKAKKNAEDLIKELKNKYKHLKDDKLFNYDFLVSQDATTLFKFNDIDEYTYGVRIDKVKEDMYFFKNEDIPGYFEDAMRETYEEDFLDPINRIFSYAYKQDFKNYAESKYTELMEGSFDPDNPFAIREEAIDPLNRLIDKAVKMEVISTDMYELTDNVLHKKIDRKAADKEYDKLFGELEEAYAQERDAIGDGLGITDTQRGRSLREKILYKKSDVPVNTRMEVMLASLKSAIILAKKEGVDEIVVPSAREIAKLRGSRYDDAFEKLYTDGLKKALNQLQQDTKGNIKVGTRVLRHDPEGSFEPDFMLDDKPMYDKDKYRESFATSINIRDLLFDPDTEALRFNMGGSVPPRALISDDAKREALLAGININRMMP